MINHLSIFSFNEKIEKHVHFASTESLEDKNIEQNDIIRHNYDQSIEEETFEDAANESSNNESDSSDSMGDDLGDMDAEMDSLDSEMDGDFGDDMGGDGDNSGDSDGNGINDLEKNKGSSLNPFTQIYQKNYLIGELNELSDSIQHTISEYNSTYADWSELNQLRELKKMLDEERNSFIMQQNPENLIKLRLYMDQYETIVKKLSSMISDKAKRDSSKLSQNNKSTSVSKN
jgi:cobalamin biosynthesis protein CobT